MTPRSIAILMLLTVMFSVESAPQSQRRRTTRGNLRRSSVVPVTFKAGSDTIPADSLVGGNGKMPVRLSGYDKPLRSSRESILATNNSHYRITALSLSITYLDLAGNELHSRQVTAPCDIPSGATRKIDFASWDTQQSFYYKLSPRPRRDGATPYNIRCQVTAIITPSISTQNKPD